MICLGIESTAHTFGVGIVTGTGEILVNEKASFTGVGMDLRALSEFHVKHFPSVLDTALGKFYNLGYTKKDITLISFSRGPGLGNALKIGALVAKTLALELRVPIVGVNHIKAHLEIGKLLTSFSDPLFIYISGVNTQIIAKDGSQTYKIYGETEDIGLGNLLDSAGRVCGLEFPAGPKIEQLAKKGNKLISIPYGVKGMNVNFGGIVSKVKQLLEQNETIEDICYSLQEWTFAMVVEIAERALAYTKKDEVTVVGGVAANERLREMLAQMGAERSIKVKFFPLAYCLDNGAMIAWQGIVDQKKAQTTITNLKPLPYTTVKDL